MLRDVTRWADDLGLADIVVLQEDDLEKIANVWVVVHNLSNLVDQVNDRLCHPVSGGSLSTKDGNARRELPLVLGRHLLDLQVSVNDPKNVELLALVLVYTLHLHVE